MGDEKYGQAAFARLGENELADLVAQRGIQPSAWSNKSTAMCEIGRGHNAAQTGQPRLLTLLLPAANQTRKTKMNKYT